MMWGTLYDGGMITRIEGRLEELRSASAVLSVGGGLWYEVMIPSCDAGYFNGHLGERVVMHTLHYIEGDPSRGQVIPRLIGFRDELSREFFTLFTKVKGIGMRKALRALVRPIGEIAMAIETKDAKLLVSLPEIGKRTAETIIAELHGKLDSFAEVISADGEVLMPGELTTSAAAAVDVLVQLGEKRADATEWVRRVLAVAPELEDATPEALLAAAYKLKGQ